VVAEGALAVADFVENSVAESEAGLASRQVLELLFGHGGTGETSMGDGWSPPERGFVWSNAPESHLRLPPIRLAGQYWLHITASPFTHGKEFPTQSVALMIDGRPAGTARARDICVLAIPLPPAVSRSGREVTLTFRFPDARRPSEVFGSDDDPLLGFSLHRLALFRVDVAGDSLLPTGPVAATDGDLRRSETSGDTDELVLARIMGLLREAFERPELEYRPSSTLRGIQGYNAAKFVRLVLALEAEFGIVLHEDEVDSIATMGDIVALLRGKALDSDRRATQRPGPEETESDSVELQKTRAGFA
jgi:acyl carrier protein